MITGRFGVEIELNSIDCRDFLKNPLVPGENPLGAETVSQIIRGLGFECEIQGWQYNHNPSSWSCKPDSSCGLEVCSPVLDVHSKESLIKVMDGLARDASLGIDERCSFHVHVELSDMDFSDCHAAILAWWIKCEHVFIDFACSARKNNYYCRPIGIMDFFDPAESVSSDSIFRKLSCKHLSANSFHFYNRKRPTLEFRIAEGTKDSFFADMWIRVILRFSEVSSAAGLPNDYLWLEPEQVIDFLDLDPDLKEWFLARLIFNSSLGDSECFSPNNREHALSRYRCLSSNAHL